MSKEATGIAGAQDYVPRSSGNNTWTCATCNKMIDKDVCSAKAWGGNGKFNQECRECYELSKQMPRM